MSIKMPPFTTLGQGLAYYQGVNASTGPDVAPTKPPGISRTELSDVSGETMRRLILADSVTKTVNQSVAAGNQQTEVFATRGESYDRVNACRHSSSAEYPDPAVSGHMSGYCGEHATVSTNLLSAALRANNMQGTPVVRGIWQDPNQPSNDHVFALLGDPRAEKPDEIAVIDSWVTSGSAHTLAHNCFTNNTAYESAQAQDTQEYLDTSATGQTSEEFEQEYYGRCLSDREKYNRLIDLLKSPSPLWDQSVADSESVVRVYRDQSNNRPMNFNFKPSDEVSELNRKRQQLNDFLNNFSPDNPPPHSSPPSRAASSPRSSEDDTPGGCTIS